MTTAIIIQARMGSTRLPGKAMHELNGKPVLAHVIERCKKVEGIDLVGLAVPKLPSSQPMIKLASALGMHTFQGEEHDVLGRYVGAVFWYEPLLSRKIDVVMRITADCPLIDPEICTKVLARFKKEKAEYASNVHPRSFPKGLDCEVFTTEILFRACKTTHDNYDREHVTPWIVKNSRRINLASGRFDLAQHRWTLDYPEDLEFMRALAKLGPINSMSEILRTIKDNPELLAINAKAA